jgi:hypothetical protein
MSGCLHIRPSEYIPVILARNEEYVIYALWSTEWYGDPNNDAIAGDTDVISDLIDDVFTQST